MEIGYFRKEVESAVKSLGMRDNLLLDILKNLLIKAGGEIRLSEEAGGPYAFTLTYLDGNLIYKAGGTERVVDEGYARPIISIIGTFKDDITI